MADQTTIDALKIQIQTLNDAIAGGEKQTVINGESVTYRSINELIAARSDAETRLNAAVAEASGAIRRPSRRTLLTYAGREYNNGLWFDGYRR